MWSRSASRPGSAERHDVPEVYTDYRAMIDSSELDALVVVMPEDLYHPMVMAGVEAALRTERTSMGFAPGAELSVLRRRS